MTAHEVAKGFVHHIIYRFGAPEVCITDRGTQFMSDVFQNVCKIIGIKRIATSSYHPQGNASVERFNGVLASLLRATLISRRRESWPDFLPAVLFAYNSAIHKATRASPHFLLYGRPPLIIPEMGQHRPLYNENPTFDEIFPRQLIDAREFVKIALKRAEQAQLTTNKLPEHREQRLSEGDFVVMKRLAYPPDEPTKLISRYTGPFIIDKKLGPVNYRIRKPDTLQTRNIHGTHLKKIEFQPYLAAQEDETLQNTIVEETQQTFATPPRQTRSKGPVQSQEWIPTKPLEYVRTKPPPPFNSPIAEDYEHPTSPTSPDSPLSTPNLDKTTFDSPAPTNPNIHRSRSPLSPLRRPLKKTTHHN